jgi:hypothetical protein
VACLLKERAVTGRLARVRDEAQARVDEKLAELHRLRGMQPERQARSEKARAAVKEALALLQEAIDIHRRLLPPEHSSTRTLIRTHTRLTDDFHTLSLFEKPPPSPSTLSDYGEPRPATGESGRSVWAQEVGGQLECEALLAASPVSLSPSRASPLSAVL